MATLHSSDGTRLAFHDFGGTGEPLLLIPGLCGYAGEWSATIEFLTATHHVFALDPRGHGDSDPRPADVSRAAHIADTFTALNTTGPATVIGQSLGGHTAFLTAASHPHLVTRLVLAEAGPAGHDQNTPLDIDNWLANWPLPFPDLATAAGFLGGGLAGEAWANGLRHHPDGWRPPFERDIMVATIAAAADPRWHDFDRITCPTLVVKGGAGSMNSTEYTRMQNHPMVTAVEIQGAGHDVHLDSPDQWRAAVTTFLSSPYPQPAAARPSTEISSEQCPRPATLPHP